MPSAVRHFYEFGPFRLDPGKHRLFRAGELIHLSPKSVEALIVLVQNPGKLLEREALMQAVWADTFVEDANLTVAISHLRKALEQDGETAEFIETVPRVGYRFVADVRRVEEQSAPLIVEKHTLSQTIIEEEIISESDTASASTAPANIEPVEVEVRNVLPESKALVVNKAKALVTPATTDVFRSSRSQLLALVSLLAVGLLGLLIYWRAVSRPKLPATSAQVKSMAVLPFKSLGANPEDEYLGLGLADALITQIGGIRQIVMRPPGAVQRYAETNVPDPLAVGRELSVEAVLEGTVQHAGDNLRVTVRLLRVGDGVVLWSGKFDEKFTDIFTMQDSISQEVAEALIWNLSREDRELLTKRYTDNVQAYQLYLKGRYFWNKRTGAGLQQGLEYFNKAIDVDPTYALAYAGLADAHALLAWQDELRQTEFVPKAKAAAIKALETDEGLGEAHASLGFLEFWYEWDFAGAESEYRRAIELKPNYATAHHWYGEFLVLMGRPDEGFKELKLAQQADPLSLIINADIGKMFFFTRQADQAIEQLQKTLEMDAQFPNSRLFLAMAYNQKGMREQAIAELQKQASAPGSRTIFKAMLGYIYAQSAHTAEAMTIIAELKEPQPKRFVPAFGIALVYAGLAQKGSGVRMARKGEDRTRPISGLH